METNHNSNVAQLRARIERNFAEYRIQITKLESEYVFELATEIAIVTDVHRLITESDYITENDAAFLLMFENPLKVLADEWEMYCAVEDGEFDDFIADFVNDGDTKEYLTVSMADELREKYGEDTPVFDMCVVEFVEVASAFFENLTAAGIIIEGAVFCGKP